MFYRIIKSYPHSLGWSCAFRQHKATSHCSRIHGYPLAFSFTFEASTLDARDWVADLGSFKNLRTWLEVQFDHKTVIAEDDPLLDHFRELHRLGGIDLRVLPRVGIESFAEHAGRFAYAYAMSMCGERVRLIKVSCAEHAGNVAEWWPDNVNATSQE